MAIKTFEEFNQSRKGKLYIEAGDENDIEWKLTIDIRKLWKQYEDKTISVIDFNNEYATLLINNSENIAKIGDWAWQDIEPVVINELRKTTREDESETVYNKLYDLFDKYEINLLT